MRCTLRIEYGARKGIAFIDFADYKGQKEIGGIDLHLTVVSASSTSFVG